MGRDVSGWQKIAVYMDSGNFLQSSDFTRIATNYWDGTGRVKDIVKANNKFFFFSFLDDIFEIDHKTHLTAEYLNYEMHILGHVKKSHKVVYN